MRGGGRVSLVAVSLVSSSSSSSRKHRISSQGLIETSWNTSSLTARPLR